MSTRRRTGRPEPRTRGRPDAFAEYRIHDKADQGHASARCGCRVAARYWTAPRRCGSLRREHRQVHRPGREPGGDATTTDNLGGGRGDRPGSSGWRTLRTTVINSINSVLDNREPRRADCWSCRIMQEQRVPPGLRRWAWSTPTRKRVGWPCRRSRRAKPATAACSVSLDLANPAQPGQGRRRPHPHAQPGGLPRR